MRDGFTGAQVEAALRLAARGFITPMQSLQ
jgi:hypothetical protein